MTGRLTKISRVFALISLTFLLMAGMVADADAARRTGLAGNQFMPDQDDVYWAPHLMLKYANRLILDMPATDDFSLKQFSYVDQQWGSGTLIFGNDDNTWAWGFSAGRGDVGDAVAAFGWGLTDRALFYRLEGARFDDYDPTEHQWFDISRAWMMGENPIGVSLGVSWDSSSQEYENNGATEIAKDEFLNRGISLQFSTHIGETNDAAIEFGFNTIDVGASNEEFIDSVSATALSISGVWRGAVLDQWDHDWGWLLGLNYMKSVTYDDEIPDGGDKEPGFGTDASMFNIIGAFGPTFGGSNWSGAAYCFVEYGTGDMLENIGFSEFDLYRVAGDMSHLILPGSMGSAEYWWNDWLCFRGGLRAFHAMYKDEPLPETEAEDGELIKETSREFDIDWNVGVGLKKGSFKLDLALHEDFVHTGYLIGGADNNENGVISLITGTIEF